MHTLVSVTCTIAHPVQANDMVCDTFAVQACMVAVCMLYMMTGIQAVHTVYTHLANLHDVFSYLTPSTCSLFIAGSAHGADPSQPGPGE